MNLRLFLKQPMQLKNESLSFPFIYRIIGLFSDGFTSRVFMQAITLKESDPKKTHDVV
jgi:hypothetical protein